MPKRKVVDEGEVVRWIEEGWTYRQMAEEYRRKYDIDTVPSLWANFRQRKGLARRIARDDDLIPWAVKKGHRRLYPLAMLRVEARRRAGMSVGECSAKRLQSWMRMLEEKDAVVHYDPDTEEGFFYVRREPGDDDLIRHPARKTTTRRNADNR